MIGQRRQRAAAELVAELGGALEQAASAGRTRRPGRPRGPAGGAAAATSGGRRRPAWRGRRRCTAAWRPLVQEVLAHGAAGVGREVLERRRVGGGGGDDDRVLHRAVLLAASRRPARRSTPSGRWRRRRRSTSWPFWLMIVSTAIAVLPVWRSPMISSRWPRPIGIMASMALMPVCSGSLTGWRSTTPGALNSTGRNSIGLDRALVVERVAERVDDAAEQGLADGHLDDAAGALDGVAFLDERCRRRGARRRRCPLRG